MSDFGEDYVETKEIEDIIDDVFFSMNFYEDELDEYEYEEEAAGWGV